MTIAVPLFYLSVVRGITLTLMLVTFVVEIVAFVHCLVQRSEGFAAIDTFPKGMWLIFIGGSTLFVMLGFASYTGILSGMVALVPITVALVYLLDVRPALRDSADGTGPW